MLYVSSLVDSGIKKKICRSEAHGKRAEKMQVTHLWEKVSATAGQNVLNYTWNPRRSLLLHISIMSQVLLEFLILNFVLILGRCLDIASLYADGLVENYLPLTCFPVMRLEKKVHKTSWGTWCAQDIPAPGVLPMGWFSLSWCGNALKSVQWEFPPVGNPKQNLHQCLHTLFHLFHCRMFCGSK